MKRRVYYVLIAIVLVSCPFWVQLFHPGDGTDDKAIDLLTSINPSYQPWVKRIGLEISESAEPYMFALQIAIGVIVFTFFFYLLKKNQSLKKQSEE
jgi:cobalt/nickel transport protein